MQVFAHFSLLSTTQPPFHYERINSATVAYIYTKANKPRSRAANIMNSGDYVSDLELERVSGSPASTILPWIEKITLLREHCQTISNLICGPNGTDSNFRSEQAAQETAQDLMTQFTALENKCIPSESDCDYKGELDELIDPQGIYAAYLSGKSPDSQAADKTVIKDLRHTTQRLKADHDQRLHSYQPSTESGEIQFPGSTTKPRG